MSQYNQGEIRMRIWKAEISRVTIFPSFFVPSPGLCAIKRESHISMYIYRLARKNFSNGETLWYFSQLLRDPLFIIYTRFHELRDLRKLSQRLSNINNPSCALTHRDPFADGKTALVLMNMALPLHPREFRDPFRSTQFKQMFCNV